MLTFASSEEKKRKYFKGKYLSGPKQGSAEGKHSDLKDCSDSAMSTASRLEFSRSAGHLNVLPPRRLNESVRRIIDYSESWEKNERKLSLPWGNPVCIAPLTLLPLSEVD